MVARPEGTLEDLNVPLDVMGQQAILQIYTQITLCFAVDDAAHSSVIDTLRQGIERTAASLPWISGQVVSEGGVYKIKPLAKSPLFVLKDLRDDASAPTMDELRTSKFPMRTLDESLLASRKTLPGVIEGPAEVLSVTAVFVKGGLLLTFTGAHSAMDMTGQGQLIDLLCKACRGEDFTAEELRSGNLPREGLVPLLDESYRPGPELDGQLVKPREPDADAGATPAAAYPPPPQPCSWVCFEFSAKSLPGLKEAAARTAPSGPGKFISTDDAITAFVWQSIARARAPRLLADPSRAVLKMTRAIDMRSRLGIPATYPGLVQTCTLHALPAPDLLDPSRLGVVAADLRAALDPGANDATTRHGWDLAMHTRALATVIARSEDNAAVSVTAALDLDVDLALSSWAKLDCYDLDFGFGRPEAVRRPRFDVVPSLVYLLPRDRSGGVAVAACLRDDDLARLRDDGEFAIRAVYVG